MRVTGTHRQTDRQTHTHTHTYRHIYQNTPYRHGRTNKKMVKRNIYLVQKFRPTSHWKGDPLTELLK